MDWQKIQDTLLQWFILTSGIRSFWRGEETEIEGRPHGELQVGSSVGIGIDETRVEYDSNQPSGRENVRTQSGLRLFTLSMRVRTRDQSPTGAARFYLEKVRNALFKPSSLATFRSANMAFVGAESVVNLDAIFDDREESEALLDVRFSAAINETDLAESVGYLEKIKLSSDIKDAGGTSLPANLQFDNEEIP